MPSFRDRCCLQDSLDRENLAAGRGFFRQGEFQHAVVILGDRLRFIHVLGQRKATRDSAAIALRAQDFIAFFLFFIQARLGANRHQITFDADVDICLFGDV